VSTSRVISVECRNCFNQKDYYNGGAAELSLPHLGAELSKVSEDNPDLATISEEDISKYSEYFICSKPYCLRKNCENQKVKVAIRENAEIGLCHRCNHVHPLGGVCPTGPNDTPMFRY
jgi:hypothetical protein